MVLDFLLWLLGLIYTASTIGSVAAVFAIAYAVGALFRYKHPLVEIVKSDRTKIYLVLGVLMCTIPILNTVTAWMLFAAHNEIRDDTLRSIEERCGIYE